MHKGDDNASSSEDGKEQKNFNLSNKSHDQLKLRVGGLQIIFVLMLIHLNCVVLSGRTNKFSKLQQKKTALAEESQNVPVFMRNPIKSLDVSKYFNKLFTD